MRVLQIGKFYPPYAGGMESVLQDISEGLVAFGHEVKILCSNHGEDARRSIVEEKAGVQVHRLATFGSLASQPLTPQFFFEIQKLQKNFDVLHFHAPNPLVELGTLIRGLKKPAVVTYHSDIVRQKVLGTLYRPALDRFLGKMSYIITASQQLIDYSPVLPHFRDKCQPIPFGLPQPRVTLTEQELQKAHELKEQEGDFVLFVGRLVSYKGVDVLLKAIKKTSLKLKIVGGGPLDQELRSLAKSLGVIENGQVEFTGRLSDSDVKSHFKACHTFVLPSVMPSEAFGVVMTEAMAQAKPVVSTKLESGVRFVNEDGVSGIQVEPSDVDELAEALNRLSEDKELYQKLSQGAADRFAKEFTLERMIRSHIDVYERALKS